MTKWPLILSLSAAVALVSCTDPATGEQIDPIEVLAEAIGPQPSHAADGLDFNPSAEYPSRDHTYDGYLAPDDGISQETLHRLFFDVAMPQSDEAMIGLLGWPISEQDNVKYWAIGGGSSELAVFYEGGKAYNYTVGY